MAVDTKYDYWALLRVLHKEYEKQYTGYYEPSWTSKSDSFDKYVEEKYGMKIRFQDGRITQDFSIVDEGKYAWCILKHK
jgi:hypothetical protein